MGDRLPEPRNGIPPGEDASSSPAPHHPGRLETVAVTVFFLNLLDMLFTVVWVQAGLAVELNIVMRDLVHDRADLFILVKMVPVSLGLLLLWRLRRHPLARASFYILFSTYGLLGLYHLWFTLRILDL